MKTWIMILLVLAFGAEPAFAQAPEGLEPGAPIRVTYRIDAAPGSETIEVTGAYRGVTPERLRLTLGSADPRDHEVPLDRLVQLEVPGERSASRGAGKGALYGAIGGAVFGLVVVGICAADDAAFFQCGGKDFLIGSSFFGGVGAGVGALIGAVVGSEEWREVRLDPETGGAP